MHAKKFSPAATTPTTPRRFLPHLPHLPLKPQLTRNVNAGAAYLSWSSLKGQGYLWRRAFGTPRYLWFDSQLHYFLQKGIKADRIGASLVNEDTRVILDNLELLTEDGSLKNAAVLLFAKRPQRYFTRVQFKLGRFGIDESDLIFDDVAEASTKSAKVSRMPIWKCQFSRKKNAA